MLTMTDIIGLSDLSAAEIAAVAKHEHVPEVIACEIGSYLESVRVRQAKLARSSRWKSGPGRG
jgi:hypothetical protein